MTWKELLNKIEKLKFNSYVKLWDNDGIQFIPSWECDKIIYFYPDGMYVGGDYGSSDLIVEYLSANQVWALIEIILGHEKIQELEKGEIKCK